MKCVDVQQAIWLGQKSREVDEHITGCAFCQAEKRSFQSLIQSTLSIQVPMPTKSLIPETEVIRKAVRVHRRRPLTRFTSIAAATVILAAGTTMAAHELHFGVNMPTGKSVATNGPNKHVNKTSIIPNQSQADSTSSLIAVSPNAGYHSMCDAVKQYLLTSPKVNPELQSIQHIDIQDFVPDQTDATASDSSSRATGYVVLDVQLKPGMTSHQFTNGAQRSYVTLLNQNGIWTVAAFDTQQSLAPDFVSVVAKADNPQLCDSVRAYLSKVSDRNTIKHIDILGVSTDKPLTGASSVTGIVSLNVQHVDGQADAYNEGYNQRFAKFSIMQGVWTLEGPLSTSPYLGSGKVSPNKTTPPVSDSASSEAWPQGIIEHPSVPFPAQDVSINNVWQEDTATSHIQVYAGAQAPDPSQGVVIVRVTSLDGSQSTGTRYPTPTKNGSVKILSANGQVLTLVMSDGSEITFDVGKRTFHSL